jgi:hypothetical protein
MLNLKKLAGVEAWNVSSQLPRVSRCSNLSRLARDARIGAVHRAILKIVGTVSSDQFTNPDKLVPPLE